MQAAPLVELSSSEKMLVVCEELGNAIFEWPIILFLSRDELCYGESSPRDPFRRA
jgi:hypothetical protein